MVINLAAIVALAFVPSYLAELRDMRDGDGGDGCHRFFCLIILGGQATKCLSFN